MATITAPISDWQIPKNCLKERSKHMFNNSLISDVKFSVNDKHSDQKVVIPAHKFILAISSPVFFKMFYGEMEETRDIIELPDCNCESFLELLRFLYYDEVKLTGSNVMEVLYLADKYIIPSLSKKCSKRLCDHLLTTQNVFTMLPTVSIFAETSAVEKCWEIVDKQTEESMNTESFLNISREMLSCVLERDTLDAPEVAIFKAVDRWATHKCENNQRKATGEEKRKHLGDAINLIRFRVMTRQEFSSLVSKTKILPNEETVEILLSFDNVAEAPLKFSDVPRRGSNPKRVRRFSGTGGLQLFYQDATPDLLAFSVNRDVEIHSVRLFGEHGASRRVKLELYHQISPRRLGMKNKLGERVGIFNTDGTEQTYEVLFNRPVAVKKNERYELRAVTDGPYLCYGTGGQAKVTCADGTCFQFSTIKAEKTHTTVSKGQFSELSFLRTTENRQGLLFSIFRSKITVDGEHLTFEFTCCLILLLSLVILLYAQ